jgi:hypothetical protein
VPAQPAMRTTKVSRPPTAGCNAGHTARMELTLPGTSDGEANRRCGRPSRSIEGPPFGARAVGAIERYCIGRTYEPALLAFRGLVDNRSIRLDVYDVLHERASPRGPVDLGADGWLAHPGASQYTIREDSMRITDDLVLTLLWWKNEQQLLDLDEDDDDEED